MATISMDDALRVKELIDESKKNHLTIHATNRVRFTLLKSIEYYDMVLKASGIEFQLWGIERCEIKDDTLWLYSHNNAPFSIGIKD